MLGHRLSFHLLVWPPVMTVSCQLLACAYLLEVISSIAVSSPARPSSHEGVLQQDDCGNRDPLRLILGDRHMSDVAALTCAPHQQQHSPALTLTITLTLTLTLTQPQP